MVEVLHDIMQEIEDVIDKVKDEELQAVMAELDKSRRVFVAGEGRSGFSARGFAMRLMHIGYTVYFVGETITPAMQAGDVFIGVSGSGKSASVVNDAKKAKDAGLPDSQSVSDMPLHSHTLHRHSSFSVSCSAPS